MKIIKNFVCSFLLLASIAACGNNDAQKEVPVYDANNQFLGILLGSTGGIASVFIPSS